MSKDKDLTVGFTKAETKKITTHLNKLLPYLKPGSFVIVGGLAIRYHLITHGISYPQRPFNDLDIIVKNKNVVSPEVAKDFLVYHYHPENFFLALVDPESKTKVDIFNFEPKPSSILSVAFGDTYVDIVSIEDQLVKTVLDLQRISPKAKVDPKQFLDTNLLMQIADLSKADRGWRAKKFKDYPKTIIQAVQNAQSIAKKHPEWIKQSPFKKSKPYHCPFCKSEDGFKVEPMVKIYKLLGYVE